jgi:surface polysaccharide O-acyltransferase-like enzyme
MVNTFEPRRRELSVDLYRVCAVVFVVVGHWLAASVAYGEGHFIRQNALVELPWTQWLTWIFQVVPVFFLVAGFAGVASWLGRDGMPFHDWLGYRLRATLGPTTGYVVVVLGVAAVLIVAKVDSVSLALSAWAVAMHLWFIPVYLVLVAATPIAVGAHRRWGLWAPTVLGTVVAATNVLSVSGLAPGLDWINNLLCWAVIYQLGIAWYFRALRGAHLLVLAITAAALVAIAIGVGPYPVSLIGVPGQVVQNSAPPSVVMLAFGAAQSALLIAIGGAVTRWLRGSRLGRPLSIANRRTMLLYLWHMIAVVILSLAAYPTGLFPQPALGSAGWWLSRLLWIAVLSVLTAGVLSLVRWGRRFLASTLGSVRVGLPAGWTAPILLVGTALTAVALWRFAADGFAPQGRFPLGPALLYACGIAIATVRPTGTRSRIAADNGVTPRTKARRDAAGAAL